ncbi:MAG: phage tail tube protein [Burkholderiales bacterium]|nr:phage tail tube protein [Burkholderiales bacterium]
MPQVTGRVFITVGGKRINSKEGATLKFGGVEREAVLADNGVIGPMEKITAPEIDCTLVHTKEVALKEIQDIIDSTISFDTDTGRSFIMTGAFFAGGLSLTKGELQIKFQGIECREN